MGSVQISASYYENDCSSPIILKLKLLQVDCQFRANTRRYSRLFLINRLTFFGPNC